MPSVGEPVGRHVDGEVVALVQGAGGDQRDDADDPFDQHGAVADRPDVRLAVDHLRRRAGRDQPVEARDRAARDRDEDEGKTLPGMIGPPPSDEARDGRHLRAAAGRR